MALYGYNIITALSCVYPEHTWEPARVATGYWLEKQNQKRFLDSLAQELHITHVQEWSTLRVADIKARGGSGLLRYYGTSLLKAVRSIYPEASLSNARLYTRQHIVYSKSHLYHQQFSKFTHADTCIK